MRALGALRQELEQLPVQELERIAARAKWCKQARPEQLTPRGDWTTWMIMTGRGWGKTRTGAEWIWWEASKDPNSINGVIAPTFDMLSAVCFQGESGLLACIPPSQIEDYNKSSQQVTLINGAQIQGLSAQEPDRIRGRQFNRVWMDEFASWQYVQESLDNINFCLRLGKHPRRLITTTPKPLKAVRDVVSGKDTRVTTGSTYDNKANLPKTFFQDIEKYSGTAIGKQEIEGSLLDWSESGIFRRSWLKIWPNRMPDGRPRPFPKLLYIILSYDTAFKIGQSADPSAMSAWGVFYPYDDKPETGVMLLDCWSERLAYPDLREKLKKDYDDKWTDQERQADVVLIEDKASGQALIPDLQRAGVPVEAYKLPPDADKIQRAHAVSHLAKRCIWVPETKDARFEWRGTLDINRDKPTHPRKWAVPFIDQITMFGPESFREMERTRRQQINREASDDVTAHDDWVDTMTQCLAWLRDSEWLQLTQDLIGLPELPPPPEHSGVAVYG